MNVLYFLEGIRIPVLNEFMLLITQLGDETVFLAMAIVLFWCIDKRMGYYLMSVGLVGTVANQFMKLWFRIPRPWVLDESFTILEQAREGASGYSFPSGHTQSSVGTFGAIAYKTKNRFIKTGAIIIAILVPFSRMYLGVHTPLDVVVAAGMAIALILLMKPLVYSENRKVMPMLLCAMTALAIAFLCFVELYPFPADIDPHNMSSGLNNAYKLLGALLGLFAVYIVDEKWLHFPVKAVWWAQIIKAVLGLGVVLLVKSGLKAPINSICGSLIGSLVRYCLVVLVAGIVWPLSFRWFGKLGKKA